MEIDLSDRDYLVHTLFSGDIAQGLAKCSEEDIVSLKKFVHTVAFGGQSEPTGETVMTRLAKQFNETCADEAFRNEEPKAIAKAGLIADYMARFHHSFGYRLNKKDANGDTAAALLKRNRHWNEDSLAKYDLGTPNAQFNQSAHTVHGWVSNNKTKATHVLQNLIGGKMSKQYTKYSDFDETMQNNIDALFSGDVAEIVHGFSHDYRDQYLTELKGFTYKGFMGTQKGEGAGETLMTRLVKQFNEVCDSDAYMRGNAKAIKKATLQAALLVRLKENLGFSQTKKDANGDSPKKLLLENSVWQSSSRFTCDRLSFEEKERKTRKWLVNAAIGLVTVSAAMALVKRGIEYAGDLRKGEKKFVTQCVNDVNPHETVAAQATLNVLVQDGLTGVTEFNDYCVKNGISIEQDNDTTDVPAIRYDGMSDRVLYISREYRKQQQEILETAIEAIKQDKNAVLSFSLTLD